MRIPGKNMKNMTVLKFDVLWAKVGIYVLLTAFLPLICNGYDKKGIKNMVSETSIYMESH